MLLREVEYARPASVQETVRLLAEHDGARALAGEQLTKIAVPPGTSDGFASVAIGRDGTCIVNAAASVNDGTSRIAIGCVDAVPVLLQPSSPEDDAVREAVRGAGLDPPADVHAS